MKKRYILYLALFLGAFFGFSQYLFHAKAGHERCAHYLPTYYTYPKEELQTLNSSLLISQVQWEKWEELIGKYFEEHHVSGSRRIRFYTYLYQAQRDAAFLSYNTHLCFLGSLDPITIKMIHLFFPDFSYTPTIETDSYSEQLANLVFARYRERMKREDANTKTFEPNCKPPEKTAHIFTWIPWVGPSPHICPPPPMSDKAFWDGQIKELSQIQSRLTPRQKELAKEWENWNWLKVINTYMEDYNTSFAKTLLVRATYMMGMYDALLAVVKYKYTHCTVRPEKYDGEFQGVLTPPKSSSFPSGHAALAWCGATILTHFFPADCPHWEQLATECSQSRLWGGVHYPIDVERGCQLGVTVGEQTIEKSH